MTAFMSSSFQQNLPVNNLSSKQSEFGRHWLQLNIFFTDRGCDAQIPYKVDDYSKLKHISIRNSGNENSTVIAYRMCSSYAFFSERSDHCRLPRLTHRVQELS
ncbi:hypothetical protein GQX74_008224 [Glossina fuscipes]|nr:hypothetical protein GQX74_008224 [Glossina fuscipes]